VYAAFFMIVMLSSIAVPGTNGFVGEFLILLGSWSYSRVYTILAATGVIFAACYMLWMYQRVFFGKVTNPANEKLIDLNLREKFVLVPLVVMIFWIGLYPKPFFTLMEPAVKQLIEQGEQGGDDSTDRAGAEGDRYHRNRGRRMTMADVIMYTKPGCPYCAAAKEHYREKNIPFEEINVIDNAAAQKKLLAVSKGERIVPVIVDHGKVTVGWEGG
jgi:glutaredoxin